MKCQIIRTKYVKIPQMNYIIWSNLLQMNYCLKFNSQLPLQNQNAIIPNDKSEIYLSGKFSFIFLLMYNIISQFLQ